MSDKIITEISYYSNPYEINRAVEKLIDSKGTDVKNYDPSEISFLAAYSGYGGLESYGNFTQEELQGLLFEFYTPDAIVKKMWGLAYKHGYGSFEDNSVFEPSVGVGAFLQYAPKDVRVVGNELNKYSAKICQILYPHAVIRQQFFEQNFIKNNSSIKDKVKSLEKFSLVIGNPPYGKLQGKYIGMGEGSYTKAPNYAHYFIDRGLDITESGGLLIYIVGASQPNGGTMFLDSEMNPSKEKIAEKSSLVEAYRLPTNLFDRTQVSSEILVFRKK